MKIVPQIATVIPAVYSVANIVFATYHLQKINENLKMIKDGLSDLKDIIYNEHDAVIFSAIIHQNEPSFWRNKNLIDQLYYDLSKEQEFWRCEAERNLNKEEKQMKKEGIVKYANELYSTLYRYSYVARLNTNIYSFLYDDCPLSYKEQKEKYLKLLGESINKVIIFGMSI
jgi:hypothetical protein